MKIKFSQRFVALLIATGVAVALRSCNGTLTEEQRAEKRRPAPVEPIEIILDETNTKEGYILDSNFDLVGTPDEKTENEDKIR